MREFDRLIGLGDDDAAATVPADELVRICCETETLNFFGENRVERTRCVALVVGVTGTVRSSLNVSASTVFITPLCLAK